MTHDEMIAVIQAHKDGKTIQAKGRPGEGDETWHDVSFPSFDFYRVNWRIKPEPPKPREFWITVAGQVWPKEEYARRWFNNEQGAFEARVIHVREVLDDSSVLKP